MNKDEAQDLLKRYANNQCTPEERILVERWYLKESDEPDSDRADDDLSRYEDEIWLGTLKKAGLPPERSKFRLYVKLASAAAVLLFIGFGAYFLRLPEESVVQKVDRVSDLLPGGKKAVLTLSDGSRIILDDISNGRLAVQGNITISKSSDGQIIYDASGALQSAPEQGYNTISTPRGGEYQVILPDGSKVWLNSASSIYFPTTFSDEHRSVTLTGEAYFEVAKNPGRPFKVSANGMEVSVLGTHFNLMAYDDEASVKATLLEGSIRVSSGRSSALVKPGEQAEMHAKNISVNQTDVEQAVAWKNGYFYFRNTDIKSVMRQLSRWYDVEVEYAGDTPETVFSGKMYRNVNASKLLDILSYFKVNFRLEEPSSSSERIKIIVL
ncbi:FecR family protein [Daejeonella sp. JGW-45]|uniref:FecR family protein n=1 Tax=Daejeonella sp. JGW-45 TaxID=3034148 RepID=UPI0023ECCE85|nr:FecR family protein [Daejeonella sp. JGW-45]